MKKEEYTALQKYERAELDITEFDEEDVITTSGLDPFRYHNYEGFLT